MPRKRRSNVLGNSKAKREKLKRQNESEEQYLQRLTKKRLDAATRLAKESQEERRERLARQRYYASTRYAKKKYHQRLAEQKDYALSHRANESVQQPRKHTSSYVSQFKGNLWNFSGTKRHVNQNAITMMSKKKFPSLPTSLELSRDWTAPRTVYSRKASATETNLCNNSVIDCPPPEGEIAIVESYSSPVKDEFETDNFETYIGPPNPLHEQNVNVPACVEIKQEPAFEDLTPSVEYFRIAQKMQEDNRYLLPEVVEEYCDDEISFEPCDNNKDKSSSSPSVISEDRTYTAIGRSRMVKEKFSPYFGPCLEATRNWNEPHRCYGKRKFYSPSKQKGEDITEPAAKKIQAHISDVTPINS